MRYNFSIGWLFFITAYAALTCAAFAQPSYMYAELVWILTVVAVCYFALGAWLYRGSRQATAFGFVLFWVVYAAFVEITPHRVPSRRVFTILGYPEASRPHEMEDYRGLIRGLDSDPRRNTPQKRATYDALYMKYEMALGERPEIAASNAIGTMVAGILGSLLAAFVYSKTARD